MADAITISIDGVDVQTQPGKMVLEAAIEAGIYIPYLCYHSGMKPFAACRMCVVAVEGGRGYPASCTLPVQEGMKIRSESHDVNELRRSVMEMLIAEHPNGCLTCHRIDICGPNDICLRHVSVNDRCVTCPKNERCEFKDTVRYLGMELESPLDYSYRQIPLEVSDPFYDRDYNLCITCGRCVRVCEEVRGDDAICFTERSGKALVGTSFGTSLLESGCEFCGACIDVCPVGALVERDHKWEKARRVECTICPHCPVGCQLNLEINGQGRVIRAIPELNSPANRGQACFKGKFGLEFVNKSERLRRPLVCRNGQLEPATWDEALDLMAARLEGYRGDSFALLASPNSTNEELYLAQKFARVVMNTNNVDQTSNIQPELTVALERSLGYAAATNPIWELEQAGAILVFNSNLTEEQNVVGVPIKRATKKGAKLVVIDPREVELTRYADLWLRPVPGTELLLLGGILKSILEQELERTEWIEENCEDPATLHYALQAVEIDEVVQATNVSNDAIAEAARLFGGPANGAVVYSLDNIPQELQRDCVLALTDLVLLTGNLGKSGAGIYPMRPGTNEQGAWDVGCVLNRLPGGRPWTDSSIRQSMETAWQCTLPTQRGLEVAAALLAAREKRVKAMLIIGDSANFTNGRLGDALSALPELEFLVVLDTFLSPPAQLADVVLPRLTFAEKDGTYTNLERRIQRLKPAIELKNSQARPESWLICQLAQRMNTPGFEYNSSSEIMDEIARLSPIYAGVSYQRLEKEAVTVFRSRVESPKPNQLLYSEKEYRGIQWPCPSADALSTPVLYLDGFPDGKANTITPEFRAPEPHLDSEFPAWLVPGRVLFQPDPEVQIEEGKLNRVHREQRVQIHPALAESLSIAEGDSVEVETPADRTVGVARLDISVPPGVIAVTTLFGQLAVDLQTSEELDPMSRVPGLDILPARLSKAPMPIGV
jgi:predicted molibdopterin-dependent oxidoreductase YjgC